MSKFNSLIIIAFAVMILSSCDKKDKNLVNTWRIENVTFSKPVPPQVMGQIKQQIEMMKMLTRITYKADGSTEEVQPDKTHKGSWEMSKDGKVIYSTNDMGLTDRLIVTELTKDKFTYLLPSRNGDTLTFYYVPFNAKDTTGKKPAMMQQPQPQGEADPNAAPAEPQGNGPAQAPAQGGTAAPADNTKK